MKGNYTVENIVALLKNRYRVGEFRFYKGDIDASNTLIDLERLLASIKLTDKQAIVVKKYWEEGYTQEEVARMLGVTQQMVEKHCRFVKVKIEKALKVWGEIKDEK